MQNSMSTHACHSCLRMWQSNRDNGNTDGANRSALVNHRHPAILVTVVRLYAALDRDT